MSDARDRKLTGAEVKRLLGRARDRISQHATEIDRINVFPVPDADTGHNVLATLAGALKAVQEVGDLGTGAVWQAAAEGAMVAARGNSGMIVAELLAGLARSGPAIDLWSARDLAQGLRLSADQARLAVYQAKEGTILTVASESAEAARGETLADVLASAVSGARQALERTTEQMAELKEAGVVDAGGASWLGILEAFYEEASGINVPHHHLKAGTIARVCSNRDPIRFRYDLELLVDRFQQGKGALDAWDAPLEQDLANLGDSLIFVAAAPYRKIHVHSDRPDAILSRVLAYGTVIHCEVWDMQTQSENRLHGTGPRPVVVIPEAMDGWHDEWADWVEPHHHQAQDRAGVFWIKPQVPLVEALAVSNFGELYHMLSFYDFSQKWEDNRERIAKMHQTWIFMAPTQPSGVGPGPSLANQIRVWADGRIVTVYLSTHLAAEEDSAWEEALDAAVVRVKLPVDQPVQIVAE